MLRLATQPRLPFNASAFGEMLQDLHGDLESNLVQLRAEVEGGKVNETNVYLGKFIEGVELGISTEIGFYYQQFSEIKAILRTKGTVKWWPKWFFGLPRSLGYPFMLRPSAKCYRTCTAIWNRICCSRGRNQWEKRLTKQMCF